MRYEGFIIDVYVVVVIMIALVSLYLASGRPVQKKRTSNVVPLLHGSSRVEVVQVQRSKTVYCGIVSVDGSTPRPLYLKKHML